MTKETYLFVICSANGPYSCLKLYTLEPVIQNIQRLQRHRCVHEFEIKNTYYHSTGLTVYSLAVADTVAEHSDLFHCICYFCISFFYTMLPNSLQLLVIAHPGAEILCDKSRVYSIKLFCLCRFAFMVYARYFKA